MTVDPSEPTVKENRMNMLDHSRFMVHWDQVFPEDVDRVRKLVALTDMFTPGEVEMAAELVQARLDWGERSGYRFLMVRQDQELVAYACFGPISGTHRRYDFFWLAVTPRLQGQGIGSQMMEMVAKDMEASGAVRIYIETSSLEKYLPTRRFHEASGYVVQAVVKDFYRKGDDKVIFMRQVGQEDA